MKRIRTLLAFVVPVTFVFAGGCGKKADEPVTASGAAPAAGVAQDPADSRPPSAEAAAGAAEFKRQRDAFEARDRKMAAEGKR